MALRESDAARARDNVVPLPHKRPGVRERLLGEVARVPEPGATIWPGPVAGLVAGVWAAAMSLLIVGGVVLGTWVFAPLGSGRFGDVMRASAASWLLANGGSLRWQGATLSLPPLLGTVVIVLFQRRAGRWLVSAVAGERISHLLQPLGFAVAAAISAQMLVIAAVSDGASQALTHNLLGAALVALVGFGWGVDRELALPRPPHVVMIGRALRSFIAIVGAGSLLVLLVLGVAHHSAFGDVLSAVSADSTSSLQVLGLCLVFVPTALLWVAATLVGSGFAVGAGTHVSLSAVSMGALPPVPLLALIPAHLPRSAAALSAVAFLAAATAVWQMRGDRSLVHRGLVVVGGALAGALLGLAGAGGFGPGRLAQLGTVWWQTGVACGGWLLGAFALEACVHLIREHRASAPADGEVAAN